MSKAFDAKSAITEINRGLKRSKAGVTVELQGAKLRLRGTLPPKPESSKTKPYSQRISLGIYGNPAGVKRAKAEALRLSSDLAMEKFNWVDWIEPELRTRTCRDWVEAFEAQYFQQRERTAKTETTWDKDYAVPFRRLPSNSELDGEVLQQVLLSSTKPDTRARQRAVTAYKALARFAHIEIDLGPYRGKYRAGEINPRDLPSDDQILAFYEQIPLRSWQCVYALMATYGLRNHECFYLDLEALKKPPGVAIVADGKTGQRSVWPIPGDWWERFRLFDAELPQLTARRNSDYGLRSAQYFKRQGMPFVLYDLRHCWAVRSAVKGLDPVIAAKMMGHSLTEHYRTYQQFINENQFQQAWEQLQ